MVANKGVEKNSKGNKVGSARPIESLSVARRGLSNSVDAVALRLAVIRDLLESRITPTVANSVGAQVSGVVKIKEMEFRYGQLNKQTGAKQFLLAEGNAA